MTLAAKLLVYALLSAGLVGWAGGQSTAGPPSNDEQNPTQAAPGQTTPPQNEPKTAEPANSEQNSQSEPSAAPGETQATPPPAAVPEQQQNQSQTAGEEKQKSSPPPNKARTRKTRKKKSARGGETNQTAPASAIAKDASGEAQSQPSDMPARKVVRNGSTADPSVDFSPGMTRDQAERQKQTTNQFIAASNANLRAVSGRSLSFKEEDLVNQIKTYQEQARKALADGDWQRGRNLGEKAYLLSKELVHP